MADKISFFKSYHKAFKTLPPEVVGEVVKAMGSYAFDGEEVELEGIAATVYELIKPVMESSLKKAANGKKGGEAESKPEANPKRTESKPKANQKQNESKPEAIRNRNKDKEYGERNKDKGVGNMDNITPLNPPRGKRGPTAESLIEEAQLDPSLEAAVKKWVKYKTERREGYKETGLETLITQIRNKAEINGITAVIECINECISAGYKGIIWDRLKRGAPPGRSSQMDEWQQAYQELLAEGAK